MKKSDLVRAIAHKSGCTLTEAGNFLDVALTIVTDALKDGHDIVVPGFGSLAVSHRAARDGRNPQTGETIKIKASRVVRFKPGKTLKDAVAVQ